MVGFVRAPSFFPSLSDLSNLGRTYSRTGLPSQVRTGCSPSGSFQAKPGLSAARPTAANSRSAGRACFMVRWGSGFAEDELVRVAGPERAAGRPPQDHLLDLFGHLEVLVRDPAGRVGLELDPQLAPGDGQVGVVVGGLANVADGVDGHERLRP